MREHFLLILQIWNNFLLFTNVIRQALLFWLLCHSLEVLAGTRWGLLQAYAKVDNFLGILNQNFFSIHKGRLFSFRCPFVRYIFLAVIYSFIKPSIMNRMWHSINFEAEFNRFEFCFPSWPVAIPKLKSPECITFTHSWRENSRIHISAIGNANSLVYDLKSGHGVDFLRR